MLNIFLILFCKLLSKLFRFLNLGNGTTWPGHIALSVNKNFIRDVTVNSPVKIILIAGTNGKTTTSKFIRTILENNGKTVIQNESGANLLSGVASTFLLHANFLGKVHYDYAIFEVDENVLPLLLEEIAPHAIVLLNLFRDQLDRYGEVNTIAKKWKKTLEKLSPETILILNADDPQIAYLGHETKAKTYYYGLAEQGTKTVENAADSIYCPRCGENLLFKNVTFSHLGQWECKQCGLKKPKVAIDTFSVFPLTGTYNKYNTLAAVLLLKQLEIANKKIETSFENFKPAFGRQEIVTYKNKKVQLFLSKNPTSFNQSYTTIKNLGAKTLLLVLNDRIPDGRDISWIWDADLPELNKFKTILISGDRVYDMALRIKYEEYKHFQTFENLEGAVNAGVELTDENETLFILPTYSAMLDARKILTGKKIL